MNEKLSKHLPLLAGGSAAVIWGFSFLFTKDALSYTYPSQLLGLRFGVAALTLTLLRVAKLIKVELRRKGWFGLVVLSLFQPGLYFLGETWGVKWTTASEAGMIIALAPICTAVMAGVFLKERITLLQVISIGCSVIGVFFIVTARGPLEFGNHLLGYLALFGAVLAAGTYSILSKKSSNRFTPIEITYVMMWSGAVVFNLLGAGESLVQGKISAYLAPLWIPSVIIAVLYLGVLSSVLGFFLNNFAISRLNVTQIAPLLNLITVVSVAGGVVFQGDPFGVWHAVGVTLIVFGVWGTNVFAQQSD